MVFGENAAILAIQRRIKKHNFTQNEIPHVSFMFILFSWSRHCRLSIDDTLLGLPTLIPSLHLNYLGSARKINYYFAKGSLIACFVLAKCELRTMILESQTLYSLDDSLVFLPHFLEMQTCKFQPQHEWDSFVLSIKSSSSLKIWCCQTFWRQQCNKHLRPCSSMRLEH